MRRFLFGALMGAGLALLFAPETGATVRSRLRDKATKLANDTEDFVEGKSRHLRNKMQGYRAKAQRFTESMAQRMSETMDAAADGQTPRDRKPSMADMGEPAI